MLSCIYFTCLLSSCCWKSELKFADN